MGNDMVIGGEKPSIPNSKILYLASQKSSFEQSQKSSLNFNRTYQKQKKVLPFVQNARGSMPTI
jgi:hypothetical protein